MIQPSTKPRHKKDIEVGRCCWVCGKVGGDGFSSALRMLGYNVPLRGPESVAHAHPRCIRREQLKLRRKKSCT
jgi:hypothetical protein